MKAIYKINLASLIQILVSFCLLFLTACTITSAPGSMGCSPSGVCVQIRATEPIRINEPFVVTGTIVSEKDFDRVGIAFSSDAFDLRFENGQVWEQRTKGDWYDIKANQPMTISHRVLMSKERQFYITFSATQAFHVDDWV